MPKIFDELKRRNVIRVGLAYLVLSWVLMQVADVLFEALRLEDTALTLLVAILALGFFPVVIFAWIYELTPEGVKRESEIDRSASIAPQTGQRLNVAIVLLLTVAVAMFAWDRFISDSGRPQVASGSPVEQGAKTDAAERSIAVLPFADMSPAGDQGYFADGISEELLNVLAGVEGLKVAARTSSFKFRGDQYDIAEIGEALKVATILEGSVRKAGDQVRVTAQLIDVDGGFHIWSESYNRKLDNIFAIQDEIAASIARALRLTLQLESVAGTQSAPESGEAYDLYLRGREFAREPSKDGLLRALRYYEQALAIDPSFTPAHGAIASAWIWLEDYGGVPSQEAFDKAEPSARRALELDPNRADALTAMGLLEDRKYLNAPAARDYFERALEVNPTFIEAYTLYADSLLDLGEVDQALEVRRKAVERDPLSSFLKSRLASTLNGLGRFVEAERLLNEIFETNPDDTYAREELANLRYLQGQLADSVEAYKFVHENRPGDPYSAANLAVTFVLMQDLDEAQRWVEAARARGPNNRWELEAQKTLAESTGDWDALFRAGQLFLAKKGATWQGLASLGKQDWEVARASFQQTLARLNYRQGDRLTGEVIEPIAGLALAEKQLDQDSWTAHVAAVRAFTQSRMQESPILGSWPNLNLSYFLAQLDAIEGDTEGVVANMQAARDQGFLQHYFLQHDPFFASVRDDPRLQALVEEMREHTLTERAKLEL